MGIHLLTSIHVYILGTSTYFMYLVSVLYLYPFPYIQIFTKVVTMTKKKVCLKRNCYWETNFIFKMCNKKRTLQKLLTYISWIDQLCIIPLVTNVLWVILKRPFRDRINLVCPSITNNFNFWQALIIFRQQFVLRRTSYKFSTWSVCLFLQILAKMLGVIFRPSNDKVCKNWQDASNSS